MSSHNLERSGDNITLSFDIVSGQVSNLPLFGFRQGSRQLAIPGCDPYLGVMFGRFGGGVRLVRCIACDGVAISERPERTTRGYRCFRCRAAANSSMDEVAVF